MKKAENFLLDAATNMHTHTPVAVYATPTHSR